MVRHRRDPWWRFALNPLAVSVVPSAITYEPFHALRLTALPLFLLLMTVPALEWLLGPAEQMQEAAGKRQKDGAFRRFPRSTRLGILSVLLALTVAEAVRFQIIFRREGPNRGAYFDAPYKEAYDAAVAQPARPIYLIDGYFDPS